MVVSFFRKMFVIRDAVRRTDQFERSFWRGADLARVSAGGWARAKTPAAWSAFSRPDSANS